jgi:hypothetical protein
MRTGVLVLRVWMEGQPEGQPRARLTATHDISDPRPAVVTVVGPDEVCAAVRAWLEDFTNDRCPSFRAEGAGPRGTRGRPASWP